ncbi:MAG: hypothetical protein QW515_05015 [Thermoplasmatales archaeon]
MSIVGDILGGIGSSVVGNLGNQISAAQQYRYQKRLMEQQNKYNTEAATTAFNRMYAMWNSENEYNAPTAQMARYKEAGLNPNLIYGQSNPSAGFSSAPSSSVSQGSAPQVRFDNPIDSIVKVFQLKNLSDQNNVLKAEAADKEAAALLKTQGIAESQARIARYRALTAKSSFDLRLGESLYDHTIRNMIARNEYLNQLFRTSKSQESLNFWKSQSAKKEFTDYERYGIRPNDNFLFRALMTIIDGSNRPIGSSQKAVVDGYYNPESWPRGSHY